jgi:uncharacterized tellurite resistance protein B-like protein
MSDSESTLRVDISTPRLLLHQLVADPKLFEWADHNLLADPVRDLLRSVAIADGAVVTDEPTSQKSLDAAHAMVGPRVHVDVKKTTISSISASLQLLFAILAVIHGQAHAGEHALTALVTLGSTLHNAIRILSEPERHIYIAIVALSKTLEQASAERITDALERAGHRTLSLDQVQKTLDEMLRKNVIERVDGFYLPR